MKVWWVLAPFLALDLIGSVSAFQEKGGKSFHDDGSLEMTSNDSNRKLQTCKNDGQRCNVNKNNCCSELNCFENRCRQCALLDHECESSGDCCGTFFCDNSACVECLPVDSSTVCASDRDCCDSLTCFGGICQNCTDIKQECTTDDECCGELVCDAEASICTPETPTCDPNIAVANTVGAATTTPTPKIKASSVDSSCVHRVTVTFDGDAEGAALDPGTYVQDEWAEFGLFLSTNGAECSVPRLFDTANPVQGTGQEMCGDEDLGSPNEQCSTPGPGVGDDGAEGSQWENCEPLGNVLIIQEPGSACPNDSEVGGEMVFNFFSPAHVHAMGFLDIDYSTEVRVVQESGSTEFDLPLAGDNGKQTLEINLADVTSIIVDFERSGAVTFIDFCYDPDQVGTAPVPSVAPLPAACTTASPTASPTTSASPSSSPSAQPFNLPSSSPTTTSFPTFTSDPACDNVTPITNLADFLTAIENASTDPDVRSVICVDVDTDLDFDTAPAVDSDGIDLTNKYFDAYCVGYSSANKCTLDRSLNDVNDETTTGSRFFYGSAPLGTLWTGFRIQNGFRHSKFIKPIVSKDDTNEFENSDEYTNLESRWSGAGFLFYDGPDIVNVNTSEVTFVECDFVNNTSDGDGGAVAVVAENDHNWILNVTRCAFMSNHAHFYGGGISTFASGSGMIDLDVVESNFTNNSAYVVRDSADIDIVRNVNFTCNDTNAALVLVQDDNDIPIQSSTPWC